MLEVLDGPLVLLGLGSTGERAEVPPLAGLRIELAGIQPILAGFEFADHGITTTGDTRIICISCADCVFTFFRLPRFDGSLLPHGLSISPNVKGEMRRIRLDSPAVWAGHCPFLGAFPIIIS